MIYYNHRQPLGTMHHTHRPSLTSTELYYHIPLRLCYVPITSQHTEPAYILILTARSAHITPLARRRSASRAYAEKTHYPQALNGDRLGAHLASEHVCVRNRTRHTDHITLQYTYHY